MTKVIPFILLGGSWLICLLAIFSIWETDTLFSLSERIMLSLTFVLLGVTALFPFKMARES